MAVPGVSVIVPHRDSLADLDRCLAALEAQTFPSTRFEIVVADNGSTCGIDAVRRLVGTRARLVSVVEPGAGPARNGGVAAASGAVLAFTDADCCPAPGWLAAGVAALEGAGLVGGAMEVLIDGTAPATPAEAFELAFAFDNRAYVERKGFSVTANLFVRRADFERVGGFRVGVSEDQDWCLRARAAGLRIAYAPDALVGHPARRDWPQLEAKWRRILREQYALSRERRFGRLRWLAHTWLIPASILPHGLRALAGRRLSGVRSRTLALRGLVRLRLWRFVEAHRLLWAGG